MAKEYIEREAAIAVIYAQHVGGKEACENARPNTFGADLREIVSDIEDIPAADVVERKRGEWIVRESFALEVPHRWYRCSVCSYETIHASAYCECCGAELRMRRD